MKQFFSIYRHLDTFSRKLVARCALGLTCFLVAGQAQGQSEVFLELEVPQNELYGFKYDGVNTNQESALFSFTGSDNELVLNLTAFDIDNPTEISVIVNGVSIGFVDTTENNETGPSSISIPLDAQVPGSNTLEFRQRVLGWKWGITDLLLSNPLALTAPELTLNVVDASKYGFNFDGIVSNRESAFFSFTGADNELILNLTAFDIDSATEISVIVNGVSIGHLSTTQNNAAEPSSIPIPIDVQVSGSNTIEFRQRRLGWKWGLTDLLLSNPLTPTAQNLTLNVTDTTKYGNNFDGITSNTESALFAFDSSGSALDLNFTAFDIDNTTEINILVNGVSIGYVGTTPNNATGSSSVTIPLDQQVSGSNTLEFRQRNPRWKWGITNLLLTRFEAPIVSIDVSNYNLIFSDEFDSPIGSGLDPSKWDTGLLWGPYFPINNEKQLYVDTLGINSNFNHSPFEFTGSTLKITATPTSGNLQPPVRPPEDSGLWQPRSYSEYRFNGPSEDGPGYQASDVDYLSGIITTYDSLKMTYGYVEMRAKLPAGRGLWPAFWLLNTHYVEDVPEIDVMEFLGQDVDTLYHTYHYFDIEDNYRKISTPSYTVIADDWTQDFHTYGMAWSPTEIIYYIDGEETRRITDDEFLITGQAMYIIANLAVGGNWPGDPDETTPFPATFEIDYIRAYERKLQPTLNLSEDYQLMFSDNFNGSTLDASKWNTSFLWGPYLDINNEDQYYVDASGSDNATAANTPFVLNNGVLSIIAREESDPNSFAIPQSLPGLNDTIWTDFPTYNRNTNYSPGTHTSGIITSYDSFKFVNGYAEMRAKIPQGQGLWPAFWLLNGYYVGQQPEIDILEILGNAPHQSYHTYHRLAAGGIQQSDQGFTDIGNPSIGYADGFHRYGVRWQRGRIDWYIDRQVVHTYEGTDVPYQLMYVIANLAVGGNWPGPPNDTTEFPASLDIDYIRVYQERHKED